MVEAWKLKPTMADLKGLGQADSFKQMMDNRLFKVILVAALSNLGAMAGVFLGGYSHLADAGTGKYERADLRGHK